MIQALAIWQAVKSFAQRLPWQAWVAFVAALAVMGVWWWHNGQVNEAAKVGRLEGATQQRETDLIETIERTEQANETRTVIESEVRAGSGDTLYRECLRTARTPANCQRFLPGGEAP